MFQQIRLFAYETSKYSVPHAVCPLDKTANRPDSKAIKSSNTVFKKYFKSNFEIFQ